MRARRALGRACTTPRRSSVLYPEPNADWGRKALDLLGVEQAAGTEPGHRLGMADAGQREAAFGAAELAEMVDHRGLGIARRVDHGGARFGVVVGVIEAGEAHRPAIFACVSVAG